MCGNCGGVKRLTRKRDMVNDGSDTKYQSCSELRIDGGVGSSMGSTHCVTGRGDLDKCSHVNCVKIQLTVDSALCPVLKVLNPASRNSARLKSMRTTHAQSVTIEAVTLSEWTVLCRE